MSDTEQSKIIHGDKAAARYLKEKHSFPIAARGIGERRGLGTGPKFRVVLRRIEYETAWLDEWVAEIRQPTYQSITEVKAAKAGAA